MKDDLAIKYQRGSCGICDIPFALAIDLVLSKDDVLAGEKQPGTASGGENILLGGVLYVSVGYRAQIDATHPVKVRDGKCIRGAGCLWVESRRLSLLLARLIRRSRIELLLSTISLLPSLEQKRAPRQARAYGRRTGDDSPPSRARSRGWPQTRSVNSEHSDGCEPSLSASRYCSSKGTHTLVSSLLGLVIGRPGRISRLRDQWRSSF